ncbi:MAG: ASPIC/UnbV domain-containing protein, partial [Candidatus Poribacteria bacterium]
ARATVTAGDLRQIREVRSGSSFLSQNDLRLHFGLDKHEKAAVEIRWPSGLVERFEDVAANQFLTITEGNTSTQDK